MTNTLPPPPLPEVRMGYSVGTDDEHWVADVMIGQLPLASGRGGTPAEAEADAWRAWLHVRRQRLLKGA